MKWKEWWTEYWEFMVTYGWAALLVMILIMLYAILRYFEVI